MISNIGRNVCLNITNSSSCTPLMGWVVLTGTVSLGITIAHYLWTKNASSENTQPRTIQPSPIEPENSPIPPPIKQIPKDNVINDPFAHLDDQSKADIEKITMDGVPLFKWAIFSPSPPLFIKLVRKGFEYKITPALKIECIQFLQRKFGLKNEGLNNTLTELKSFLTGGDQKNLSSAAAAFNQKIDVVLQNMKENYDLVQSGVVFNIKYI